MRDELPTYVSTILSNLDYFVIEGGNKPNPECIVRFPLYGKKLDKKTKESPSATLLGFVSTHLTDNDPLLIVPYIHNPKRGSCGHMATLALEHGVEPIKCFDSAEYFVTGKTKPTSFQVSKLIPDVEGLLGHDDDCTLWFQAICGVASKHKKALTDLISLEHFPEQERTTVVKNFKEKLQEQYNEIMTSLEIPLPTIQFQQQTQTQPPQSEPRTQPQPQSQLQEQPQDRPQEQPPQQTQQKPQSETKPIQESNHQPQTQQPKQESSILTSLSIVCTPESQHGNTSPSSRAVSPEKLPPDSSNDSPSIKKIPDM